MSYDTYTATDSETFTVTDARHIAAKVATDLKRMQRFYNLPDDDGIECFEKEVVVLLNGDYIDSISYGFLDSQGNWALALKYQARSGGVLIADDDPGNIPLGVNLLGCWFYSYLVTNRNWMLLSDNQRWNIRKEIGFHREEKSGPTELNFHPDKTYSAGGRGVMRSTVK